MKILLSSNMQIVKKYVQKDSVVGFIPTASEVATDRSYMVQNKLSLQNMGYEIIDIEISTDSKEEIVEKLNTIDALYVAGGNCFYLLQQIKQKNVLNELRDFADKKIYIGASAGSCIACPSIEYVYNLDDRNAAPLLTDCHSLNLINAYILPHYKNGNEYDALIDKTISENPNLKFIVLTDSQAVIVNSNDDYSVEYTD